MSDDVYRRAGRGGAGNYYSKKDIAEVDKRVREQQVSRTTYRSSIVP